MSFEKAEEMSREKEMLPESICCNLLSRQNFRTNCQLLNALTIDVDADPR